VMHLPRSAVAAAASRQVRAVAPQLLIDLA